MLFLAPQFHNFAPQSVVFVYEEDVLADRPCGVALGEQGVDDPLQFASAVGLGCAWSAARSAEWSRRGS